MTDRRSQTSRANLGKHIPEALAPEGTEVIAIRLPKRDALRLRAAAKHQGITLSEYIRRILTLDLIPR